MASAPELLAELKVEEAHVRKIETLLRQVLRQANNDILRLRGGTSPSAVIERLQAEAIRAAVKRRLAVGFTNIESNLATGQRDAAEAASRVVSGYEATLLKYLGVKQPELDSLLKSEAQRAANGVESAVRRMAGQTYKPLSNRVYDTRALADGTVDNIVNKALARGSSWQELARDIRSSIDPNTPGGVSYAAKRLARTEMQNAFHASTVARAQSTRMVDAMEWNLSSSHPENDECNDYADKSPYDVNDIPAKPHPQCYCYLTAALPDEELFLKKLFNGDYDDPEDVYDGASPTSTLLQSARRKS